MPPRAGSPTFAPRLGASPDAARHAVLVGGRAFVAYPHRAAAVLHVADSPEAFGRELPADMALFGDIGSTLCAAAKRLADLVDREPVEARLDARGARKRAATEALRAEILAEAGHPLSPDAAVGGARRAAAERRSPTIPPPPSAACRTS